MATKISWTNEVFNCITGCTRISPGCGSGKHGGCYAEKMSTRLSAMGVHQYDGVSVKGRWTNKVRYHPELLEKFYEKAMKWKKPRMVFANSMSDWCHKDVPFEFAHRMIEVFANIAWTTGSKFQLLTKRPERQLEIMKIIEKELIEQKVGMRFTSPLTGIWLGVSVENQQTADERIPLLLKTPADVKFLSVEPMLEKIDLFKAFYIREHGQRKSPISWAIVGCESGPNRRPMPLEWARSIVQQCKETGTPCFVKQLSINGKVEHDITKFPEDLRIQEFPN